MADMLTLNSGKSVRNDVPAKQERGRSGRNAAVAPVQSIGPLLRERREAMGVTLAEAEVATRIRQKYLAALEADEWDLLPGEVVGRGFLRNYSTYLGLEPTEMIDRRRAVADESLAAVLVNTSAGSALPPERKVDYRPKDVALKDEGDELETPRQINWTPFVALLAIVLVAGIGYLVITQLGPQLGDLMAAGQRQLAALTAPAPATPEPRVQATLPPNLTATGSDAAQATPAAAVPLDGAAQAGAAGVDPAAAAPTLDPNAAVTQPDASSPAAAAPTLAVQPTPQADAAAAAGTTAEEGSFSLLNALPTPTPQPPEPTPAPTPAAPAASVNAGANLRSGPSTDYPILGGIPAGQAVTITGISADGTWYQLSDGSWVFGQLVTNPPAGLPVVEAPPLAAAPVEAAPVEAAPVEAAPAEAAPATP